jgi:hypothetical protein
MYFAESEYTSWLIAAASSIVAVRIFIASNLTAPLTGVAPQATRPS